MHTLIDFNLAPPARIEHCYFSFKSKSETNVPEFDGTGLFFSDEATITFDTAFSAFFETVWFEHTNLQSVYLTGEIDGVAVVTLFARNLIGDTCIYGRATVGKTSSFSIKVEREGLGRDVHGRLWAVIQAPGPFKIRRLAWATEDAPIRTPGMALVFNTMNRQKYLLRALREIADSDACLDAAKSIVLVNQGDDVDLSPLAGHPRYQKLHDKLHLVRQGNRGGAGGFTRGIIEAFEQPGITHVVICDDDISFESSSIPRVKALLSYADDRVSFGGMMMDLRRPNMLYESGADLRPSNLTSAPVNHDLYLGASETTERLMRVRPVDYCGWWFFTVSRAMVEKIGYPLPCFIRGDDIEYGIRIKHGGGATVVVPGIAVWHEPFYMKLGGWHFYFEIRNRLMLMATQYDRPIERDIKQFFFVLWRDIVTCRYYTARLMIKAIADFRAGPDVSMRSTPEELQAARALAAEFGPTTVPPPPVLHYMPPGRRPRSAFMRGVAHVRMTLQAVLPGLARKPLPKIVAAHDFNPWVTSGASGFTVQEPDQKTFQRFTKSQAKSRFLFRQFRRETRALIREWPELRETYKRATAERTTLSAWQELLALKPAAAAPKKEAPAPAVVEARPQQGRAVPAE